VDDAQAVPMSCDGCDGSAGSCGASTRSHVAVVP
jgi:hypothetical protein